MMRRFKFSHPFFVMSLLAVASPSFGGYLFQPYGAAFAGYEKVYALGIADDGTILSSAFRSSDGALFYILHRGRDVTAFEPSGGFFPIAVANGGVTVGNLSETFFPFSRPKLRLPDGTLSDLSVPNVASPMAAGLNNLRTVAGTYETFALQRCHGFFASPMGNRTYDYPGAFDTRLYDVNDSGWAAGFAEGDGLSAAFVTNGAQTRTLDTGLAPGDQFIPRHINGRNDVAGTVALRNPDSSYRRLLGVFARKRLDVFGSPAAWPATIDYEELGRQHTATFVGEEASITGINDKGVITVSSAATYRDESGFDRFFAQSFVGRPE